MFHRIILIFNIHVCDKTERLPVAVALNVLLFKDVEMTSKQDGIPHNTICTGISIIMHCGILINITYKPATNSAIVCLLASGIVS